MILQQPSLLIYNETIFMYYDYGIGENSIGVATSRVWAGSENRRITNFPNPVDQSTTFSYNLNEPANVTIQIFNSFGQMVAEPLNSNQSKGDKQVTWNAGTLPAEIYFYRIQTGKETGGGKIIKW